MKDDAPLIVAPMPAELPRCRGARSLAVGPGPFPDGPPELPGRGPLLVTGTCGALLPGVERSRLVLPAFLVDGAGRELWPDEGWRVRLRAAAGAVGLEPDEGGMATAAEVVDEAADREELARRTGCGFVDLESAELALAAQRAGRPWVVLRFVSDGPEETLAWLAELYGGFPDRQPGLGRTLAGLARRPGLLRRLVGLGRAVSVGRSRAARVLRLALAPTRPGPSA